jgi:surfeit locus 1 family protein
MKRRVWPVLLASALGFAMLVSLGIWQVQRLAWKNLLIANFESTAMHVGGQFSNSEPRRLLSSFEGKPAWLLVQPFLAKSGHMLLVARGKISTDAPLPPTPNGQLQLHGYQHIHNSGRGLFDVDNKPAENQWFYWDVDAMLGQPSIGGVVLHLAPGSPGTDGLLVDAPKSALRNNHLGYAITWFGLAAVLAVMTVVFLRSQGKKS